MRKELTKILIANSNEIIRLAKSIRTLAIFNEVDDSEEEDNLLAMQKIYGNISDLSGQLMQELDCLLKGFLPSNKDKERGLEK